MVGEEGNLLFISLWGPVPGLTNSDAPHETVLVKTRYTRATLKSTLQLMGCKPRYAHKVSSS